MINSDVAKAKKSNTPENKIKNILISQPKPNSSKSPYFELAKKHKMNIDFRPFIHVEGVPAIEFRKSKINLRDYSAIIMTSRNAVDHFFRICGEMRTLISQETRYFCMTETIAHYLQKYILYRKRKVSFVNGTMNELQELMNKHKEEKFLFLCSDVHKKDIPEFLEKNGFTYNKAVIYKTIDSALSDLPKLNYDMIVFFSPAGVRSLFKNFPQFKQKSIRIAAFGPATCKAVIDGGLRLDVKAPIPEAPSMTMALDKYLQKINK